MDKPYVSKDKCFGCEACSYACPVSAIKMEPDEEGFLYPVIDASVCIDCGNCSGICPSEPDAPASLRFFALRTLDNDILYKSTSGGAFSLIANYVLEKNGVICGAVYDDDYRVIHKVSDDIAPMRKPKYVQSSIGSSFESIKAALAESRPVLFTGTPCQCEAVKNVFLSDENIIYAALVCRGVASPKLWGDYVKYLQKDGRLTSYCSRDKRKNDDAHTVAYTVGGKETAVQYLSDPFSRIYAKELPLRPSCYQCPYACVDKSFDFVIGDFWGVEKVFPEFADGKGTSLVITGSDKASEILSALEDKAIIKETQKENVMQPALASPAKASMLRRFLFKDVATAGPDGICDIPNILKKYGS